MKDFAPRITITQSPRGALGDVTPEEGHKRREAIRAAALRCLENAMTVRDVEMRLQWALRAIELYGDAQLVAKTLQTGLNFGRMAQFNIVIRHRRRAGPRRVPNRCPAD